MEGQGDGHQLGPEGVRSIFQEDFFDFSHHFIDVSGNKDHRPVIVSASISESFSWALFCCSVTSRTCSMISRVYESNLLPGHKMVCAHGKKLVGEISFVSSIATLL